jgi:acetyl-CoA carboxylase biotin carboxyl carrier protein
MAKKGNDDADQGSNDVVAMARGLAEIVSEHHLTELVIESAGTTITVRREAPAVMAAPMATMPMPAYAPAPAIAAPAAASAAPAAAAPAVDDKAHVVTSPFVGTFYRKPNPDSPSYVNLNDRVEKGAVLCIVEAMKLMNEIEADASGVVIGILVEDGAPVEYGQPLFKIRT